MRPSPRRWTHYFEQSRGPDQQVGGASISAALDIGAQPKVCFAQRPSYWPATTRQGLIMPRTNLPDRRMGYHRP